MIYKNGAYKSLIYNSDLPVYKELLEPYIFFSENFYSKFSYFYSFVSYSFRSVLYNLAYFCNSFS